MQVTLYGLNVQSSDMTFSNKSTRIVILQPPNTIGMRSAAALRERAAITPASVRQDILYGALYSLWRPEHFLHFGNLKWGGSQMSPCESRRDPPHGAPKEFTYCGALATIARDERGNVKINCEQCGTVATSRIPEHEFPTVLLHLAIKQMVPELPACNFVACDRDGIGTVAICRDALGITERGFGEPASLGFTLMPGMRIDR
jgi:hypothetical protein